MRRVWRTGLTLLACAAALGGSDTISADAPAPPRVMAQPVRTATPALPLVFVPNAGQTDARVKYFARAGGTSIFFTRDEAVVALSGGKDTRSLALRLAFVGTQKGVAIEGRARQAGVVNYLTAGKSATTVPTFGEVFYRGLWKGVDLGFTDGAGRLKYEFTVAPGASPDRVRLEYRGADRLRVADDGSLVIETALGTLRDAAPETYQVIDGQRVEVKSRYRLTGRRSFGFDLGDYDTRFPVVIDPGIEYSTFLSGNNPDSSSFWPVIEAGQDGTVYVAGPIQNASFPTTAGAFDTSYGGNVDGFVARLSADGSSLLFSTFIGGSNGEELKGLALDTAGGLYLTGLTSSADFPVTPGAYDTTIGAFDSDAFVVKMNATSGALIYGTFVGGNGYERAKAIAVNGQGQAFITGEAAGSNFPATVGTTSAASEDVFIAQLSADGSSLLAARLIGGSSNDGGEAIALRPGGGAWVTGNTFSSNFPVTPGAFDTSYGGNLDAFVVGVAADFTLVYSTYLGGPNFDEGLGIAVGIDGELHVVGDASLGFPVTTGIPYNSGGFLAKFGPEPWPLVYSTFVPNSNGNPTNVIVDGLNRAYISGYANSGFATTPNAVDRTHNGSTDATLTILGPLGDTLYATYLGGSTPDQAFDVALDGSGGIYVSGRTTSSNFPTTPGGFDRSFGGGGDYFVTKLTVDLPYPSAVTLSPTSAVRTVSNNHSITATVTSSLGVSMPGVLVRFLVNETSAVGRCRTGALGTCSFSYTGPAVAATHTVAAWADSDIDAIQDPAEPNASASVAWLAPGTGALQGLVTNAATNAPVAGTTVSVFNSGGSQVGSSTTNESGTFAVSNLAPGTYFARTADTLDLIDELFDDIACELGCTVTSGAAISIQAGVIRFISFHLSPATALEGVVSNTITGAPIASAQVQVYSSTGAPVANATTDGNGFYRIDNLRNDLYRARTTNNAGFVDEVFDDISCALGCSIASGTLISTTAGQTSFADFGLLPAGGGIAGVVTKQADGEPLAGATVIVFNSSGAGVAAAVTNANGEYLTGDVPTGNYFVKTANNAGFIDELFDNIPCAIGCNVTSGTVVTHAAGVTGGFADFALEAGGRVRGTVTGEGTPVPNAPVHFYSAQTGALLFSAVTNASGIYETPGLPSGIGYYARTGNAAGLANEAFDNVDCALGCDVSTGALLSPTAGAVTQANFDLGPNTPVRESNFIIPELPNGTTPTGLMFFGLTAPGRTTVTASGTGPALPASYSAGDQPVFHTLQTTASFNVGAIVCFVYPAANFDSLSAIKLLQHSSGAWNDITTSGSPGQHVCGVTATLGQFTVVEQTGP